MYTFIEGFQATFGDVPYDTFERMAAVALYDRYPQVESIDFHPYELRTPTEMQRLIANVLKRIAVEEQEFELAVFLRDREKAVLELMDRDAIELTTQISSGIRGISLQMIKLAL